MDNGAGNVRRAGSLAMIGLFAGVIGFLSAAALNPSPAEAQGVPPCAHTACEWGGTYYTGCMPWSGRICHFDNGSCEEEVCDPQ